jgi:dCMP deaminase
MTRPSWDEYFIEVTRVVARRATCLRRQVGAIVVKDKRILSTGYNGAPSGLPHCLDVGCLRDQQGIPSGERQELCRGLHAEQNAIIQASHYGTSLAGSTIYVTLAPCVTCAKMIINAGIKKVIYCDKYTDQMSMDILAQAGVEVVQWPDGAQ